MAISYLSPASYMNQLPAMDKGPLSGFLSGMNQDLANQITQRGFADDDLQREVTQQKLDEARQLQPLNVGIKNSEAVKAAADDDYYKNGDYAAMRDSTNTAKKSANDLEVSTNDVRQQLVAAPLWEKMAQELKSMGGQVDWTNPDHRQWWDTWRQRMSRFAPNMPAFPDTADTMKVIQTGDQATKFLQTQNAGNDLQYQRKLELATAPAKINAEAHKYGYDRLADSREAVQDAKNQGAAEVQRIKNEKAVADAKGLNYARAIVSNAAKTGQIDEAAIGAAQDLGEADLNAAIKSGDPSIKLGLLDNPQYREQLVDNYAERKLPGYKVAKLKMQVSGGSGNASATAATAPKADDMATMVKSAFGSYEPDKYEYRINPQTGKPQRKPK